MKVGLLVRIVARPEHADEVAAMLRGARELVLLGRSSASKCVDDDGTRMYVLVA